MSPSEFVLIALFAAAAAAMGRALAQRWRRASLVLPYALLLAAAERFFRYALFDGDLLAPGRYLFATVILVAAAALAYRVTEARRMVRQYPWLYEANGWFAWRERRQSAHDD